MGTSTVKKTSPTSLNHQQPGLLSQDKLSLWIYAVDSINGDLSDQGVFLQQSSNPGHQLVKKQTNKTTSLSGISHYYAIMNQIFPTDV